jgi:antitoxin VapB
MPLHIRDETTSQLVRTLARRKGIGLTDAVKLAVQNELRRDDQMVPLRDRVAAIRRTIIGRRKTGKKADKSFFDDLSGEP